MNDTQSQPVFHPARLVKAAQAFIAIEASSGIVLVAAALAGLLWVNSPWGSSYVDLWASHITLRSDVFTFDGDLRHVVDDVLMTGFFFLVGLEIKRELVHGEMSDRRRALLPAMAALGGMVVPALIYLAINSSGAGSAGWGVPMATDIAFSLGVLSLAGSRVPFSAKVFLLALAIVDDIGAVVVIAVFYTSTLDVGALLLAVALLGGVVALQRLGVRQITPFIVLGGGLWMATYASGVHATLAGVALGLLTPARSMYQSRDFSRTAAGLMTNFATADEDGRQQLLAQLEELSRGSESTLDRLERALLPWVSYGVVPLFGLANAGLELNGGIIDDATSSSVALGVMAGLLIGKPLGIFAFSWLSVRVGLCDLPQDCRWTHIFGIGLLGGIGFTISLLIADLAFEDQSLVNEAKLAVLAVSVVASCAGYLFLRVVSGAQNQQDPAENRA